MYTGLYLQLFIKKPDTKEPEQRTTLRIFSFMLIRMLNKTIGKFGSGIKGWKQLRIICNSVTIPCCLVYVLPCEAAGFAKSHDQAWIHLARLQNICLQWFGPVSILWGSTGSLGFRWLWEATVSSKTRMATPKEVSLDASIASVKSVLIKSWPLIDRWSSNHLPSSSLWKCLPFSKSFQGRLLRLFCLRNHLVCQDKQSAD